MSTTPSTPLPAPLVFPLEITCILKIKVQSQDAFTLLTSVDPIESIKTDLENFLDDTYGLELVSYEGKAQ